MQRKTEIRSTKMYQLLCKSGSNGKYLKRDHATPLLHTPQVQKQRTDPPIIQIPSPPTSRTCSAILSPHIRRDTDKIKKIQRRATKMIPEIINHSYHQRIQDLDFISLVQRIQRGQLIEMFKYLNRFTTDSARGLFDYDLNDRTRNNGAKLTVKHFNKSVEQHFTELKYQQPGMPYQVKL